ncbi:actin cortical patch SUR7/pH-response regulator pali [Tuber indicum]|nr:actin cortical patch SUR7/pH-response regulator pali [Tuber indicum]
MRFSAIVPIALSIAAFILSMLVLFAGRNNGFLGDTYVTKIDTSNLNVSNTGISALDNILSSAAQDIVNTTASRLGLHDFYKVFVMNYCEGERDSNDNERITNCTKQKGMFTFNPVGVFERELLQGVTLRDLGVNTQDLDTAINVLKVAYRTMFVTYCIGITAAGIAIILGFLGFIESRLIACSNWMFAVISFLFLGVASGIGTTTGVKIRDAINREMGGIGVRAYISKRYLGMTWAAVICMLIVTFFWCGACFSRRKNRTHHKSADENQLAGSGPVGKKKRSWRRWGH